MKIGIFGDSYADVDAWSAYAWPTFLAQLWGAKQVENHASSGSSLFWTYQQLLTHGDQYDRVIVAVTDAMRYPVKYKSRLGQEKFVTFNTVETRDKSLTSTELQMLKHWFVMQDKSYAETVQELILRDIERRFPNCVLIPCFHDSFNQDRRSASKFSNFCLHDITYHSRKITGHSDCFNLLEKHQYRGILCHIPWEWHNRVAKLIHKISVSGTAHSQNLLSGWTLTQPWTDYFEEP